MSQAVNELPRRLLMGPGPSDADPRVLAAMATPLVGHLDPAFLALMDDVQSMLRDLFRTGNAMTFPVSATGSAGMESTVANLVEPGDGVLVCVNGVFGGRMCDVAERCGATVTKVEAPWGKPIDPADVRKALDLVAPKIVAIVHAETSTGVLQPLEEIGSLVRDAGALYLVDAVTSLGGVDVRVDDWGIDAVYSGTQKCLSAPPGLSPVSFSTRALEALDAREGKVQSWYLDITMLRKYWGSDRVYHHTAPISSIYALHEALRLVMEEGPEQRFERHRVTHEYLRDQLESLGFEFLVAPEYLTPMLNTVRIPDGFEDADVRRRLLVEHNIEIGAGLGDFAGKFWRIGLMGGSCRIENVDRLVSALRNLS